MGKELELKVEMTFEKYENVRRLLEEKAQKQIDKEQEDVYYSPVNVDFYDNGDRCLRIRQEDGNVILSYKRIYEGEENSRFIEEYETRVESFEIIDSILLALYFEKVIIVKKKRSEYRYKGDYLIALDIVDNLGYFIEIENKCEKDTVEKRNADLLEVAKMFELDLKRQNIEGYSNMLYRKYKEGK